MGKKSIYCSDDEEVVFERAKALSGGSISPLINKLLKEYVQESEYKAAGMKEVTLFIGHKDHDINMMDGERVKFVGKFVGTDKVQVGQYEYLNITLYYTKKGKFLKYTETDGRSVIESNYKVIDSMNDLYSAGLPPSLVNAAEKLCPEIPCKVLDI